MTQIQSHTEIKGVTKKDPSMRVYSRGTWPRLRVTEGFPEEAMFKSQRNLFKQGDNHEEEKRKRKSSK